VARRQPSFPESVARDLAGRSVAHEAFFYEDPASLDAFVLDGARDGLSAGEVVVVMARPARLESLAAGRWPRAARLVPHREHRERREHGELVLMDAEAMLAAMLVDGRIEARAFAETVSRPLDALRARVGGAPVRVVHELGDILVVRRQHDAAIALAALWRHEVTRASARCLGAYALDAFVGSEAATALERLGRMHAAVRLAHQPDAERWPADYWALLARQRDRERHRLEAALAEAERRAQVGMLAVGLAHDLGNLLVPVLHQAEALASGVAEDAPRAADDVWRGVEQLAALVGAMMHVASPAPATTPVSLHKVAAIVLTVLRSKLRGVTVKLESEADLPPVAGHESSLLQVLLNLVQNAREAITGGGGTITVSIARCAAPAGGRGDWIRLSVTDTGSGMTAAQQARLFEPFHTTKPNGHGIGLASVRTLVEAMGGRIDVHSAPGRGTVVAVRLRAAAARG
jgi:signal transduction histidine kinase